MEYRVWFWGQGPFIVNTEKLLNPNAKPGDLLYGMSQAAMVVVDEENGKVLSISNEFLKLPSAPVANEDAVTLETLGDIAATLAVGEISIVANESVAVDDCLHVVGQSASGFVVQKALAGETGRLPCAGFAKSALAVGEAGKMWVGTHLSGIGTTDYPFRELYVGTDGKIAWLGSGNCPSAGEHINIIGVGRGVGKIQCSFNARVDAL